MTETDPSHEEFQVGWGRDHFDTESVEEVENLIDNENLVNLLLVDYEQASEDGRNRDNLLHNSFYVSLVLLGLILNVGLDLFRSSDYVLLFMLSTLGTGLYSLLGIWSISSKGARDSSWDRRSEIEDMIKPINFQTLRSNDSCFKRLTRVNGGQYKLVGKKGVESFSMGRLIVFTNFLISLLLGVVAILSIAKALCLV